MFRAASQQNREPHDQNQPQRQNERGEGNFPGRPEIPSRNAWLYTFFPCAGSVAKAIALWAFIRGPLGPIEHSKVKVQTSWKLLFFLSASSFVRVPSSASSRNRFGAIFATFFRLPFFVAFLMAFRHMKRIAGGIFRRAHQFEMCQEGKRIFCLTFSDFEIFPRFHDMTLGT